MFSSFGNWLDDWILVTKWRKIWQYLYLVVEHYCPPESLSCIPVQYFFRCLMTRIRSYILQTKSYHTHSNHCHTDSPTLKAFQYYQKLKKIVRIILYYDIIIILYYLIKINRAKLIFTKKWSAQIPCLSTTIYIYKQEEYILMSCWI